MHADTHKHTHTHTHTRLFPWTLRSVSALPGSSFVSSPLLGQVNLPARTWGCPLPSPALLPYGTPWQPSSWGWRRQPFGNAEIGISSACTQVRFISRKRKLRFLLSKESPRTAHIIYRVLRHHLQGPAFGAGCLLLSCFRLKRKPPLRTKVSLPTG